MIVYPLRVDVDSLSKILAKYHDDPVGFNRFVLGRGEYWEKQVEVAAAIPEAQTVVVATGNSVGKSYLAAGLILWWLYTRPNSLVIVSCPSQTLLGTVLFKEIRKALESSHRKGIPLPGSVTDSPSSSPQVLEIAPGWSCFGISTVGVERLSGQHNPDLLAVLDEASGVSSSVWEAITSLNPRKLLIFGNPLQPHGQFQNLFDLGRRQDSQAEVEPSDRVKSIKIASTESPDWDLEKSPRGLADRNFARQATRIWGVGTPMWNAHVLGEFPRQSAYALLEKSWLDIAFAIRSVAEIGPVAERVMAIDLAAGVGGDRTVILIRDSNQVLHLESSNRLGLAEAAARSAQLCKQFGVRPNRLIYDAGGLGRDFPEHLRLYSILDPQAYAGSYEARSSHGLSFLNLRATCAWRVRRRLDPNLPQAAPQSQVGGSLPQWLREREHQPKVRLPFSFPAQVLGDQAQSFLEELQDLRYVPGLKLKLEPKEESVKRLGRSPDLADAFIMSYALDDGIAA